MCMSGLAAGSVALGALPQSRDSANDDVPTVAQLERPNGKWRFGNPERIAQNLIR